MTMAKRFSPAVHEAVDLLWGHYNPESAARGQEILREEAQAGDADAWGLLARTYMGQSAVWETSGIDPVWDKEKMEACLQQSLKGGSAAGALSAFEYRGFLPSEYSLVLSHWGSAEALIQEAKEYAGEGGEPLMAFFLGACYEDSSLDVITCKHRDKSEKVQAALPYLEASLEAGLPWAMDVYTDCAISIYHETGDLSCYRKVLAYEKRFCEEEVPYVLWGVGQKYYDNEDYRQALPYYQRAAALGSSNARCKLGRMMRYGQGLVADPGAALEEYFLPLAEKGHVEAMYEAAAVYFTGELGKPDFEAAFSWCERALDRILPFQGTYRYDDIMPIMCYCKLYGEGTLIDRRLAARSILEEVRRQERNPTLNPYMQDCLSYLLGEVYAHGYGDMAKDRELAKKYHQQVRGNLRRSLEKLPWERSSHSLSCGIYWTLVGTPEEEKEKFAGADTIRSWQEGRFRQKMQACELGLLHSEGCGVTFKEYGEEEIAIALDLLAQGAYFSIFLGALAGDDRLRVYFEEGRYRLFANLGGSCFERYEMDKGKVLACLKGWLAGKGIGNSGWQQDARGGRILAWNRLLNEARDCHARGDEEGRIAAWEKAAQLGCGHAMNQLGIHYCDDFKTAAQWFLNATLSEDADDVQLAWYSLGRLNLQNPEGDGNKAFCYLTKAAEMGCADAWSQLGLCYLHGVGTVEDFDKCVACYDKGAALGDYQAMYARACVAMRDEGDWHDPRKAVECLQRVVSESQAWQNEGRVLLAQAYLELDAERYDRTAYELLHLAEQAGCSPAAYELAHYCRDREDMAGCRHYLEEAAAAGLEAAREELEGMAPMSSAASSPMPPLAGLRPASCCPGDGIPTAARR